VWNGKVTRKNEISELSTINLKEYMLNKLLPNDFNFVYNICLFNYRR
jgi:hypothetical protein